MLGERDDVRAYRYKAKRAAILIYTHFRKEYGFPIRQIREPVKDTGKEISLKE
jgi:hypothetical protein